MVRWTKEFRSMIATYLQTNAYVIHTTSSYASTRPSTNLTKSLLPWTHLSSLLGITIASACHSRIVRLLKLAVLTESLELGSTGI